eukprot:12920570-Prorocentrum_lima.AAC.1
MDAIPKPIQVQCRNYGIFGSVGILVRVMRKLMPARDLSRLSTASDVFHQPRQVWPYGWKNPTPTWRWQ